MLPVSPQDLLTWTIRQRDCSLRPDSDCGASFHGQNRVCLNIAQNVAFKQGMTVAMFSLEMSKEQFVNRLFSLESKVDSQHLRTGNLADAEWESLIEKCRRDRKIQSDH